VIFHPDQPFTGAIRTSSRSLPVGLCSSGVDCFKPRHCPFRYQCQNGQILWVKPTYIAIHAVLSNPVYAGAYRVW